MCEGCFRQGYHGFASRREFAAFEAMLKQVLQHKCASGQLRVMPADAPGLPLKQLESRYCCRNCGTVWALSSPDNAWRGYFLPEAEAHVYLQRSQRRDKARRWGCLPVLLAALLAILWKLLA